MIYNNFKRSIYIGECADGSIHCHIEVKNKNLSISGVIGAKSNGDCKGSCGQISDTIRRELDNIKYALNWDKVKAFEFLEYWDKYHLNDMRAGTKKQEDFVKKYKMSNKYDYEEVREAMKKAGVYDDNGYKYGTSWLREEVPLNVLSFMYNLPVSLKSNPWN